jgi:hypothetical protein
MFFKIDLFHLFNILIIQLFRAAMCMRDNNLFRCPSVMLWCLFVRKQNYFKQQSSQISLTTSNYFLFNEFTFLKQTLPQKKVGKLLLPTFVNSCADFGWSSITRLSKLNSLLFHLFILREECSQPLSKPQNRIEWNKRIDNYYVFKWNLNLKWRSFLDW